MSLARTSTSGSVLTDRGAVPYDYLVLATGSRSEYFGNESLARHAFGLKDLDDGLALRNRVLSQFESSRWTADREQRRAMLTFAVVGGGPTGVELAGSLSELIHLVLRKDYRDLDLSEVRVLLLEAADSVLAAVHACTARIGAQGAGEEGRGGEVRSQG